MTTILIPTYRTSTPSDAQAVWGDLRVALMSIASYAPDVDVIVAWGGREEPRDLPRNERMRLLARPETVATSCEGWNWAAEQTEDDDLILMNDDAVFRPDSVQLLMEDVAFLKAHPEVEKVGLVGMRSNFIKGPQNIRYSNGGQMTGMAFDSESRLLELEMTVPVVAYVSRRAFFEVSGFPPTNWFGDDILCYELKKRGYRHFASRAYCHHVGQRGTGQNKTSEVLLDEGLTWLRERRPDVMRLMAGA